MSNAQYLIYALHNPESPSVYVGKSAKGMSRPQQHEKPWNLVRYKKLGRSKWIQSLYKRGLKPEIVVLEECAHPDDLNEAERFWIASFRAMGMKLLNHTDGGDGVLGHKHSAESVAKMTAKNRARATTEEGRKQMSAISLAGWEKPGAREKKRLFMTGRKQSPEAIVKTTAAHKGVKRSPESCARQSAAAKARWANPEYRARQIASQKASHSSDESKEKAAEWAKQASHDTHHSPEYRAKQSALFKELYASDEARAKKSATTTRIAQDPEYIAKLSAARTLWWANRKKRDD